jgi:putative transposase
MSRYRRAVVPGGTFFFTVNLADRQSALLTARIDLLWAAYRKTRHDLPFNTLAICVLPDHLHALWSLPPGDADFSTRWQRIKSAFSVKIPPAAPRSESQQRKREKGVWQRRFWEHQIRDEIDLQRHVDYIHYNPVKHGLVQRVSDWPHSSFHRYVRSGDLPRDWAGVGEDAALLDFGE